jgi:hypothetical protein
MTLDAFSEGGTPFGEWVGQRLYEINATLVGTRIDAHEGLVAVRRVEDKVDRLLDAVARLQRAQSNASKPPTTPMRGKRTVQTGRTVPDPLLLEEPAPPPSVAEPVERQEMPPGDNPVVTAFPAPEINDQMPKAESEPDPTEAKELGSQRYDVEKQLEMLDKQLLLVTKAVVAPLLQRISAGTTTRTGSGLRRSSRKRWKATGRGDSGASSPKRSSGRSTYLASTRPTVGMESEGKGTIKLSNTKSNTCK